MTDPSKQAVPADKAANNGFAGSRRECVDLLSVKAKEWAEARKKDGPLQLLDLPLDILKCIMKEVTHTNDLTSLALTNSALNNLAIPHIYNRFDIVWPDAHSTSEPRNGVDALTYGLATLVMREDLFGYAPPHSGGPGQSSCLGYTCNHCGMVNDVSVDALKPRSEVRHLRKGNLFSQYTRKFSLGNGPADWVQEYLINKEGGKMLGTLIALTIARMPNLETMIWDMPTGIVREVWHALASLGDRREERGSRLEKVWVRLPDNREVTTLLPAPTASTSSNSAATLPTPNLASFSGDAASLKMSYERIEHPNFSILPPMKSLSVLEIDELAYLKELSVLVRRSYESIRELRLGISKSCAVAITQKPAISELSDSQCRALGCYNDGGILGLVLNEIYDCRKIKKASTTMIETSVGTVDAGENLQKTEYKTSSSSLTLPFATLSVLGTSDNKTASVGLLESPEEELSTSIEADSFQVATSSAKVPTLPTPHLLPSLSGATMVGEPQKKAQPVNQGLGLQVTNPSKCEGELSPAHADASLEERATASSNTIPVEEPSAKRLMLETLELERIPLSINVLQKTIDWSVLTAITLLDCGDHERLWKTLRRLYSPKSSFLTATSSLGSVLKQPSRQTLRRVTSTGFNALSPPEYRLNLRRIHTDSVSPALISFLKETLAPNSLEWMLLQEHGRYESPVTVDAICRGPLRHHRASLTKVLIDSGDIPSERGRSSKWKKWILNHDVLTFITSGKMSCLRELGMTLDHKDWHYFLQRLPNIPHLRSLYVPHFANHLYGHNLDAKELAHQIVDLVIALRPEIELCYLGIITKCFEILENRNHGKSRLANHDRHIGPGGIGESDDSSDADSDETDDDHDEEGDGTDSDSGLQPAANDILDDSEDAGSDTGADSAGDTDDDMSRNPKGKKTPRFRLREILFYDDKISIFKARHGRL